MAIDLIGALPQASARVERNSEAETGREAERGFATTSRAPLTPPRLGDSHGDGDPVDEAGASPTAAPAPAPSPPFSASTAAPGIAAAPLPVSMAASVAADAHRLSSRIAELRSSLFAPDGGKVFRPLPSGEVARLLGVSDSYLRHLALSGEGPDPEKVNGRRLYTLEQVAGLRDAIHAKGGQRLATAGWPTRGAAEHCQVLAVANFKGGSGKTTTATHLAQSLAMRGYRTLAVDLDPQASMTALLGHQPETDVGEGETLYGAIRYEGARAPAEVVRRTYVHLLDLVPGNLELHEFEHDTPRMLAAAGGRREVPFFARVAAALDAVSGDYDVMVLDCPPQLGFLTLGALCAATGILVTVHPQMLDVASMSQFLNMTADLMGVVEGAGASPRLDFMRYLVTRHEPQDGPQAQVIAFLRTLLGERVLVNTALKSAAVSDAGLSKQTLYEVPREAMDRRTYDRARASLDAVNGEVEALMRAAWGRA